ncbi:hypothetical protein ATCC90586_011964 [Pythium insidiosum]|nr:hypothetical protein ATCC90586_011964 [Pythium insidiosum]
MVMSSAAKARARAADALAAEMRRQHESNAMLVSPTACSSPATATHAVSVALASAAGVKTDAWVVLQKSTRGVVAAFVASARPLTLAALLVGLVYLALKCSGRFQLWMTAAGVVMLALSVATAYQEVIAKDRVDYLSDDMETECGKIITIPTDVDSARVVQACRPTDSNVALDVAAPVLLPTAPSQPAAQRDAGLDSCTLELGKNKRNMVTVVHCGTVIDIQGARGFIIPHASGLSKPQPQTGSSRPMLDAVAQKLPLVIQFDLSQALASLRHEISVGMTVEFGFSPATEEDARSEDSRAPRLAFDVRPVASAEQEILKSRHALQTCKQARQASFARAMGELKMISPRNTPVMHHVDLIKYAEHLDDDADPATASSLDQFF